MPAVTAAGRRLANRPSSLRIWSRPSSGVRSAPGPLGPADRAEQDRIGLARGEQRSGRQRIAVQVDRGTAEIAVLEGQAKPAAVAERGQAVEGDLDHLGPDAVAGQDDDIGHAATASCCAATAVARTRWTASALLSASI